MTESSSVGIQDFRKPSASYTVNRLFNEETTVEREIIQHSLRDMERVSERVE
jgi:hypothetical protein